MLTLRGRGVLSAALAGFVLALFTLNLIAITIAVFALTFVTAELLLFARATRTISAQSFRVGRTDLTSRLSAGGLGAARLQLRSTGPHAFYAEITDSVPEVFEPVRGDSRLITWWPEGATMTLGYVFRARARGYYAIGPTEIVARDDLGLSFRRVTLRSESWVTVSPSAPEVTLRRSTLHLAARQAGQRPVARRGYGTEFRSLRPYQEGDDYRWIAWARSRRGQLVVRQFEQESCQDFLALISLDRTMEAGVLGRTALDYACEAGMVLADYIPRGGDRLGLYLCGADDARVYIPPGRSSQHAYRISEALSVAAAQTRAPQLDEVLRQLPSLLHQPTHVFAFATVPTRPGRVQLEPARIPSCGSPPLLLPTGPVRDVSGDWLHRRSSALRARAGSRSNGCDRLPLDASAAGSGGVPLRSGWCGRAYTRALPTNSLVGGGPVTSRSIRAALILPLFGFLLYLLLGPLAATSSATVVVFAVLVASNGLYLIPRWGAHLMSAVALIATLVALLAAFTWIAPSSVGALSGLRDELLALWLALPFLAIGTLTLSDVSAGDLLLTFEVVVLDSIVLIASLDSLASAGTPYTAANVVGASLGALSRQFHSWLTLFAASGSYTFPLQSVGGSALVALAAIALLGVLLPILDPVPEARTAAPVPTSIVSSRYSAPSFRELTNPRGFVFGAYRSKCKVARFGTTTRSLLHSRASRLT